MLVRPGQSYSAPMQLGEPRMGGRMKPNTFGVHLKVAVQAVGGRKFKSCGQVYEGVRIPPTWRERLIHSA